MSSGITTLLNAVTATGAGAQFDLSALSRYQGGQSFEVSGTFVGSVDIEGSIDTGVTWHSLQTFTDAGGLYSDSGIYTHIRGNVTAWTSGSITLKSRYSLAEDLKTDIDTLLARLSSARATYLDQLAASNIPADVTTLINRLSSARATLLDNLTRLDSNVSSVSASVQLGNLIKQLRKEGRLI